MMKTHFILAMLFVLFLSGCKEEPSMTEKLSRYLWKPERIAAGPKIIYREGDPMHEVNYSIYRLYFGMNHLMYMRYYTGVEESRVWIIDEKKPKRIRFGQPDNFMDIISVTDKQLIYTIDEGKYVFWMVPTE